MARVKDNAVTSTLRGALGDFLFREINGKVVVSIKHRRPARQSKQQKENRSRFKEAAALAKQALLNEEKKTYYQQQANILKLPNAYTAALREQLRVFKAERHAMW